MYPDNELLIDVKAPEEMPPGIMSSVTFFKNPHTASLTADWNGSLEKGYASPPCITSRNGKEIMFTRDQKTGGSWFAINDEGTIAVLLDLEADNKKRKANNLKSCSLVMMDIISATSPLDAFGTIQFRSIEAFSMILYLRDKLYELLWNGNERSINNSDCNYPQIWTITSENNQDAPVFRKTLFESFIITHPAPSAEVIRALHERLCAGPCISQAVLTDNVVLFYHTDALEGKFYISPLPLKNRPFIIH